ncbi:uncharacterized protein LOC144863068 [Branchiostoma floridae x Branchiostoma japonicum]
MLHTAVSISPKRIQDLLVGESVTITCKTTWPPSDNTYQWTVNGTVVPKQRGPVFRYVAVSGIHNISCNVTSSNGETESDESIVTVLPEGTVRFVSSIRITDMNFSPELADPTSAAFQNISSVIVDWYQQALRRVQGKVSIRVNDVK